MIPRTPDQFDAVCEAIGMTGDEPLVYRRDFVEAIRLFAARTQDSDMEEAAVKTLGALWSESMADEDAEDIAASLLPIDHEAKRMEGEAMESAYFELASINTNEH